jgi:predicted small metal-binding protein
MPSLCSLRRERRGGREVRVIDCNECGETLKAANDEELASELSKHMEAEHSDVEWDDEQASELISSQAYDATDS